MATISSIFINNTIPPDEPILPSGPVGPICPSAPV